MFLSGGASKRVMKNVLHPVEGRVLGLRCIISLGRVSLIESMFDYYGLVSCNGGSEEEKSARTHIDTGLWKEYASPAEGLKEGK